MNGNVEHRREWHPNTLILMGLGPLLVFILYRVIL
jgi:hypothetical protein